MSKVETKKVKTEEVERTDPYREAWEREKTWAQTLRESAIGIADGFKNYLKLAATHTVDFRDEYAINPDDSEFAHLVSAVWQFSEGLNKLIEYNDVVLCAHLEDRSIEQG